MKIVNGWVDEAIEIDYGAKSMSRQGYKPTHVVLHGTAGGSSAQGIANYFATSTVQASAHFIIGQDGAIVQGISADDAAWGNGILDHPRLPFPANVNPNLYTVSVEHVKVATDNSNPLTDAQKAASFKLIAALCQHYNIPARPGDVSGGIIAHADLDSVSRARCPGPYPWQDLWAYLKGSGVMLPSGWSDNGLTLTCNGFVVVKGFRDYVLQRLLDGTWRGDDVPCENEQSVKQLEQSNPGLGAGSRQRFRYSTLEYNQERGVFQAYTGPELIKLEQLLILASAQIQQLQKQQPAPTPLPANISQATQAINAILVMAQQLQGDGDTIATAAKNALVALGK